MAESRGLMREALSVSEGISATAELVPDSCALSYGDQQLTYAELERRAGLFAAYLTKCGVKPGGTVAICLERSFDWIVAALGIMRAGAAYVPLDPAWPDSRLRFAQVDSASTLLVARAALLDRLQVTAAGVDPLRDAALIAASPTSAHVPSDRDSLAYVIYTSGSTGTPKGVEITHANLTHLASWHRKTFNVRPGDRTSHLAGLAFDAAVWELWPNLCAGATICLADDAVRSSALLIRDWLIRDRVTVSFVPTVHAATLMSMEWPAATDLRLMLTGGDVLQRGPADDLPFAVANNYGPTECTVVSTSSLLQAGEAGRPAIGRPIAGATIYLLDERGDQVSEGLSGEIYIGGGGVGRGYRNLAESTARSFIADPFSGEPDGRMYRTGDYGIRRPDGEIEFCGRSDRQVKIRGQRVELDEVGAVLSRHPDIEFASVSLKTAAGEQSHLAAYVFPKQGGRTPSSAELQYYLQCNVPDYMIPSVFMELHSLPLTPNAKVDTKLMQLTGNTLHPEGPAATAAALPIAGKLLAMFQEILHYPAMTADDNFFLAGGHSLLSMQLVTRLRATFDVELTFQEIFAAPTVNSLAPLVSARLRENRLTVIWKDLLGRKHISLDDPLFERGGNLAVLSALRKRIFAEFGKHLTETDLFDNPTIRRQATLIQRYAESLAAPPPGVFVLHPRGTRPNMFWLHNRFPVPVAKELGDDYPFVLVTFTSRDMELLGETPTLKDIATYTLGKILTTQPQGPYIIAGICIGSVLAYEVASQLRAAGEEVSMLLMIDAPTQPYVELSSLLITRLKHPRFYLYRAITVLGFRRTLANFWARATRLAPYLIPTFFRITEKEIAHRAVVKAASEYYPAKYDGKTMLLLAKERDPLFDFLPGWQSLISKLEAYHVPGRHRDVVNSSNVRQVANLIRSGLSEYKDPNGRSVDVSSWAAGA